MFCMKIIIIHTRARARTHTHTHTHTHTNIYIYIILLIPTELLFSLRMLGDFFGALFNYFNCPFES